MLIHYYQSISRQQDIKPHTSLSDIFGAKKLRKQILPLVELYDTLYRYECVPLSTCEDIQLFYTHLYLPFISNKEGANIIDIPERIIEWINKGKSYVWLFSYDKDVLIAGKILSIHHQSSKCIAAWTAYDRQWYNNINTYLEYKMFEYFLQSGCKMMSLWTTQNLSWLGLWSWPSVALHKMQYHFMPFVGNKENKQSIDIAVINKETMIFMSHDDVEYDIVHIVTPRPEKEAKEYFWLVEKRWLSIERHFI